MVSVPLRVAPGLASKLRVARPLPVPAAEGCSHGALAVADQAPLGITRSESLPAAGPSSSAAVPRWGPAWVTVICCPSTVRCAVRGAPELAVKEKWTTPLAALPTVSQLWSLLG